MVPRGPAFSSPGSSLYHFSTSGDPRRGNSVQGLRDNQPWERMGGTAQRGEDYGFGNRWNAELIRFADGSISRFQRARPCQLSLSFDRRDPRLANRKETGYP